MYGLELIFFFSVVTIDSQIFVDWTYWVLKIKQNLRSFEWYLEKSTLLLMILPLLELTYVDSVAHLCAYLVLSSSISVFIRFGVMLIKTRQNEYMEVVTGNGLFICWFTPQFFLLYLFWREIKPSIFRRNKIKWLSV